MTAGGDGTAGTGSVVPVVLDGLEAVRAAVGARFGPTPWVTVGADRVAAFGAAVGSDEPLTRPYLVLSLSNHFMPQLVEVRGVSAGLNVGVDRVRFIAAVPTGTALRATAELATAEDRGGGVQTTITITIASATETVCEIDAVSRWLA